MLAQCLIVQLFDAVAFRFESSDFNLSPESFLRSFIIIIIASRLSISSAFFSIRQPLAGRGCAYGSIKKPTRTMSKEIRCRRSRWLDSDLLLSLACCCCCSSCDIIQARCNELDKGTMDSSTHTPNAHTHTHTLSRAQDKRRSTSTTLSSDDEFHSLCLLLSVFLFYFLLLCPASRRGHAHKLLGTLLLSFLICVPQKKLQTVPVHCLQYFKRETLPPSAQVGLQNITYCLSSKFRIKNRLFTLC